MRHELIEEFGRGDDARNARAGMGAGPHQIKVTDRLCCGYGAEPGALENGRFGGEGRTLDRVEPVPEVDRRGQFRRDDLRAKAGRMVSSSRFSIFCR